MNEPREIKFDEVRVGDTIRLLYDIEVGAIEADALVDKSGVRFEIEDYDGFILLNRPLPKHKYAVGQKVSVNYPAHGHIGDVTELIVHNNINEPRYVVKEAGNFRVGRIYPESELTPVEEEVWKPTILDYVCYEGEKHVITALGHCFKNLCLVVGIDGIVHNASFSELTPWQEAQP